MPRDDDDDDTLDTGSPTPKVSPQPAAKPSRFHSRYLKDADSLGLSQEEIEECKDNSELAALISHERSKVAAEQTRNRQPARRREDAQQAVSPPPPPPKDPEYDPGEDLSHLDPAIRNQVVKLGNMLLKATKKGDKDRMEEISERIEALEAENKALKAKSHPKVIKANKILDTYEMFGDQEDRSDPNSREAKLAKMVEDHIFGTMQEEGSFTDNPGKDIPAAMAVLFPGVKPGGKEAAPAAQNGRPASGQPAAKKTRLESWSDAGDPPPTDRNGAAASGKPGGTRAAVQKVREKRRELGITAGDEDYGADDDDDDI